ncbi:hypothetical protein PPERSA_05607 [Pseudocohnilembus persalinus]|uniref:Transmembrane protein n=1 Tax=Pseudocohnilembus persalinus TaxID=266149 RepID=A0A0V0QE08_PSEPJ|nr:hypothetical protein PPERSA_05607 [Pseudocohnilembus persalinus]|eukprot:KRX00430.1 hypothetical protein PPERSA_05607 [Pseudocohnilembus persalinus]
MIYLAWKNQYFFNFNLQRLILYFFQILIHIIYSQLINYKNQLQIIIQQIDSNFHTANLIIGNHIYFQLGIYTNLNMRALSFKILGVIIKRQKQDILIQH